jgi:hypothetical protein
VGIDARGLLDNLLRDNVLFTEVQDEPDAPALTRMILLDAGDTDWLTPVDLQDARLTRGTLSDSQRKPPSRTCPALWLKEEWSRYVIDEDLTDHGTVLFSSSGHRAAFGFTHTMALPAPILGGKNADTPRRHQPRRSCLWGRAARIASSDTHSLGEMGLGAEASLGTRILYRQIGVPRGAYAGNLFSNLWSATKQVIGTVAKMATCLVDVLGGSRGSSTGYKITP